MLYIRNLIDTKSIPMPLKKYSKTELIWVDDSFLSLNNLTKVQFKEKFSYISPETVSFASLNLQLDEEINGLCERYGGSHIGVNGGGGRVANIHGYQVKGVGANRLVGRNGGFHHSYGGLDVFCAVNEVILTRLVNKVLPVGAVDVFGLILVDRELGRYHDGRKCWNVLLVREQVERPAHLLHASFFKPVADWSYGKEEARIKFLYKSIHRDKGPRWYLNMIGSFLEATSNQFAFSRMARFIHGCCTDSNLSLNGKWLDVPLVGVIPTGKNRGLVSHYYDEPFDILRFVSESLHNYSKYNQVYLDSTPLNNFYLKQYESYKRKYAPYLMGVDLDFDSVNLNSPALGDLTNLIHNLIVSADKETDKNYPRMDEIDPISIEIKSAWNTILNLSDARSERGHCELADAFLNMLNELNLTGSTSLMMCCISSIKRLFASKFFFFTHTNSCVEKTFCSIEPSETTNYINKRFLLIDWIFEVNLENIVTVFRSERQAIIYNDESKIFTLESDGESICFADARSVIAYIELSGIDLIYCDFDFKEYVETLFDMLVREKINV